MAEAHRAPEGPRQDIQRRKAPPKTSGAEFQLRKHAPNTLRKGHLPERLFRNRSFGISERKDNDGYYRQCYGYA